ncbi:MAG TPA: multicopper oxidase family protein [Sporichthyaceae bacterium]|nr:multicopper oxidase family protein [Sporichthyaceae bacterium]
MTFGHVPLDRRTLLRLGALGAGSLALTACGGSTAEPTALISPDGPEVQAAAARRAGNGRVRTVSLRPTPATVDLGGVQVATWTYDGALPGKEIRVQRGDTIEVTLANELPTQTTVHWHGLALRNDMDGMPGVTQTAIAAGATFTYRFVVDTAGTYWFHPHTGLQLDRGLYAPLIVEDPTDPDVDADWVIVLDDWLDGIDGATPDSVYASLRKPMGAMHMDGPGMLMGAHSAALGGDAGDVAYPHFLANGRIADAPPEFSARPRDKVRIRLINAGADTAFRVALAGHRFSVTHADGYPVKPIDADCLLIGMGERYDVTVTLADGVFPLVAAAEGKDGLARALVRTGAGTAPAADFRPTELTAAPLALDRLVPRGEVELPARKVDRTLQVRLTGGMKDYNWTMNGAAFDPGAPLTVRQGERVRLNFRNDTTMWHPMHIHGHTLAVGPNGVRKDTVSVLPGKTVVTEFDANNPGQWMLHCHNAYHLEAGMMRDLAYRR